jgi:hypothetical protein
LRALKTPDTKPKGDVVKTKSVSRSALNLHVLAGLVVLAAFGAGGLPRTREPQLCGASTTMFLPAALNEKEPK